MDHPILCFCVLALAASVCSTSIAAPPKKVDAVDFVQRTLYHSPETPGYTSWVGLWQMPDGKLRCDFNELTGPKVSPVSSVPVLESADGGATWTRLPAINPTVVLERKSGYYQYGKGSNRGLVVLPEGTMVRPVCLPDAEMTQETAGYVERSTDGGKTWGKKIYVLPLKEYQVLAMLIRRLRDGRLVLFAAGWKRNDGTPGAFVVPWTTRSLGGLTKMMFVSSDKGKTWSKPIVIMPTEVGACEESDFCELPNGDLFWVHRVTHFPDHSTDRVQTPFALKMGPNPPQSYWYQDRMQSIVHKRGKTFVAGECEPASLPHSGYPMVMHTQENIILHLATDGMNWTADRGKTWTRLDVPGTPYYPRALQLKDGTILVVGHIGSDDNYGTMDQSIVQQTFRLRVTK
ncbi:MAG: exo-alpha-sialidase [Armatimonadetes bacterium]|nr:exo-alpha-sialidase [Armatimonadota bacterium]